MIVRELGSVCDVTTGQSAPQSADAFSTTGIPFIRAGSLESLLAGKAESSLELINDFSAKKYKLKLFPKDTILFAKSGMSAKLARVYRIKSPCYVVSHLAAILPSEDIYPGYLHRWFEANPPSSLIANDAYPSIKTSEISKVKIPLPPLPEQKRIAAILDKADAIRRKRQQAIQLADDFLRAVFLDMFGDPNSNSKNVPVLPMTDVFNIRTGSLNSNAAVDGGRYPFFTCAKEVYAIDDFAFDQEALLLAGNNAQADYDVKHYKGKFNAYQRTYVLTLQNERWSYPFYKFALEYQLANLKRVSKGSSTKYITMEIMRRTLLPVPSEFEQRAFVKYFDKIEDIQNCTERHEYECETLFSSLSQKAFSGEI